MSVRTVTGVGVKEKESGMEKALREVSEEKREKERDREKEGETY